MRKIWKFSIPGDQTLLFLFFSATFAQCRLIPEEFYYDRDRSHNYLILKQLSFRER
jgi:hypothetical protein